eukprot:g6250.t1
MFLAGQAQANSDHPINGFQDSISDVTFQPSQNNMQPDMLACSSWDNNVRLFQVQKNQQNQVQVQPGPQHQHKAPVLCCAWGQPNSPHQDLVFTGSCDNTYNIWNYKQNKSTPIRAHQQPVSCIGSVKLQNGSVHAVVTAGWDKFIKYWDIRQQQPAIQVQLPERAYCMDTKGQMLVVGCSNKNFNVYNLNNPQQPVKTCATKLKSQPRCVSIMNDLQGFCTGSIEGRVAVEYINPQPKVAECFAFKCHRDVQNVNGRKMAMVYPVNAISFNAHNGVATAGADGFIHVWDTKEKSKIKSLPKSPAPSCITSIAYNTSSSILVYANCYDWHKGKGGFNQQLQNTAYVHVVKPDEIKSQGKNNNNSGGYTGGRGW